MLWDGICEAISIMLWRCFCGAIVGLLFWCHPVVALFFCVCVCVDAGDVGLVSYRKCCVTGVVNLVS